MNITDLILNSPVYQQRQAQFQQQVSEPWYKLTDADLEHFDRERGMFNEGYNPYPGKTIWGGWNLGHGADLNAYYAGSLDPSFFQSSAGNDASGGFMGNLARDVREMAPGLSIMALPFAVAAGAGLAGAGAAEGGAAGGVAAGAEAGAGATGIDASTGLFAGESATSGAAGGGLYGGGGSESLIGGAEADTLEGLDLTRLEDPAYWNPEGGTTGLAEPGASGIAGSSTTYGSTDYLQAAKDLAKELGITPASALGFLKNALVRGAPAALGAVAANRQADSLSALAKQYMDLGAPSRARYEASFAPGFTMENDPGYKDALDATTKATLHRLSVNGNPAGSPNAWDQTLTDVNTKLALPALQNFRNMNANAGGIATLQTAAPGAATGAINAQGNVFNAIGAGVNDIFNPKQSLAETLAEYQRRIKAQQGTVQ